MECEFEKEVEILCTTKQNATIWFQWAEYDWMEYNYQYPENQMSLYMCVYISDLHFLKKNKMLLLDATRIELNTK